MESHKIEKVDFKDEDVFYQWCEKLKVPKQERQFSALIEEHAKERKYRKIREKEEYIDQLPWEVRRNIKHSDVPAYKKILAIDVSDAALKRAYLFMDCFLKAVVAVGGYVGVDFSKQDDNTIMHWDSYKLSCRLYEEKARRGTLQVQDKNSMRPSYELVPTGKLVLELIMQNGEKISFHDMQDVTLESSIGTIFKKIYPIIRAEQEESEQRHIEEAQKREEQWKKWELQEEREKELKKVEEQRKLDEQYRNQIVKHIQRWNQIKQAEEFLADIKQNVGVGEEDRIVLEKYFTAVDKVFARGQFYEEIIQFAKENL